MFLSPFSCKNTMCIPCVFMVNLCHWQQIKFYVPVFEINYIPTNLHYFHVLHINTALKQKKVYIYLSNTLSWTTQLNVFQVTSWTGHQQTYMMSRSSWKTIQKHYMLARAIDLTPLQTHHKTYVKIWCKIGWY
jgi:hypothetical protein